MKNDMKNQPKTQSTERSWVRYMAYAVGLMIALLPFHAFLTVWGSQLVGHYTLLRLWKEFLLLGLLLASLLMVVRSGRVAAQLRSLRRSLAGPIWLYVILVVVCGAVAYLGHDVTRKAVAYGVLLDTRFLLFFLVTWYIGRRTTWLTEHWKPVVLIPASLVIVFGILQFTVLPPTFLGHFGYGPHTIPAAQTVDQKAAYQRIQATLRGANPLGAYLIIIIVAIIAAGLEPSKWWLARPGQHRLRGLLLLAASGVVLILTFSRSAWIGATVAVGWLVWLRIGSPRLRRRLLVAGGTAVLLLVVTGFTLRHNDVFQNTFFHTDEHSRSSLSSDQGHLAATRAGLRDIVHQPLGGGTGTAGPASTYNQTTHRQPRIAENYFVQIAQETGLLGLGLFVAINLSVGRRLWRRRGQVVPDMLLASLIGISVVNLLSHAWADDTLCYIWWGLAGAAVALPVTVNHNQKPAPDD